jgi:hypothetical protein
MAKFIRKPEIIEAEQFLLEEQHPIWGGAKEIYVPAEVLKHKGCGYRMCDICGGANPDETIYYIKTSRGIHYVSNNSWIITNANGEKNVCDNKTFKKTYEKIN